jgi:hypothetical protein
MTDSNLQQMESALRKQQQTLTELIDIALHAVRESGDTSVTAMHLQSRLQALADSLKPVPRDTATAGHVSELSGRRAF